MIFLEVLCYNHYLFLCHLQEYLADKHCQKQFLRNNVMQIVGRSMYLSTMLFVNMPVLFSERSSSSSLDLIILILFSCRFVLIKETPGQHSKPKFWHTASCADGWRVLINEYAVFSLLHAHSSFVFFISFASYLVTLKLHFQILKKSYAEADLGLLQHPR